MESDEIRRFAAAMGGKKLHRMAWLPDLEGEIAQIHNRNRSALIPGHFAERVTT